MTNGDISDDMVTEWPSPSANQRPSGRVLTNQRPGAICNGNISDDRGDDEWDNRISAAIMLRDTNYLRPKVEIETQHFADDHQCQQCDQEGFKMPGIVLHNRRCDHAYD